MDANNQARTEQPAPTAHQAIEDARARGVSIAWLPEQEAALNKYLTDILRNKKTSSTQKQRASRLLASVLRRRGEHAIAILSDDRARVANLPPPPAPQLNQQFNIAMPTTPETAGPTMKALTAGSNGKAKP